MCFGLPFADGEDDDRVGRDAPVGLLVPVPVDEPGVDERVHVEAGREEDDVGVQAGGDGLGLVARGAVRLREVHVLAVRASAARPR